MKKKITVPTNARLFALSAMHSALCILGALILAFSLPAEAQPSRKLVRIGYLGMSSGLTAWEKDFVEELRKRGWIEGQTFVIERRYWENRVDRLSAQAAELVSLKVDIIVTSTGLAAQAAKEVTAIIPIVMVSSADAVTQRLAISLSRPGGNVTGLTDVSPWVTGKRLELMKEAFPKVSRVAVLNCGESTTIMKNWSKARDAARVQKIQLLPVIVRGPGEIGDTLEVILRERVDAL